MNHLLDIDGLTEQGVLKLCEQAKRWKGGEAPPTMKEPVFVGQLFFEPSTRTRVSFEAAAKRLGYQVLTLHEGTSSTQKGESLADTVKTFEAIGMNIAIMRHSTTRYWEEFLDDASFSLVNGGDGSGAHPTQSLLDVWTMHEEFGAWKDLRVAIIGDIAHNRAARSNAKLLQKLGATMTFSAPDWGWDEGFLQYGERIELHETVSSADVVYCLRNQWERVEDPTRYQAETRTYCLTEALANKMQPHAIVMHPAPINRGVEIESSMVDSERSRIFQQMKNGVFMRMAILHELMTNQSKQVEDAPMSV